MLIRERTWTTVLHNQCQGQWHGFPSWGSTQVWQSAYQPRSLRALKTQNYKLKHHPSLKTPTQLSVFLFLHFHQAVSKSEGREKSLWPPALLDIKAAGNSNSLHKEVFNFASSRRRECKCTPLWPDWHSASQHWSLSTGPPVSTDCRVWPGNDL